MFAYLPIKKENILDTLGQLNGFFGFGVTNENDISSMVTQDITKGVTPEFLLTIEPDINAAKREGRPMFVDRETVILHVAGDQFNAVSRPVDQEVKDRYPTQYAAWTAKRDKSLTVSGTPLTEWPIIGPAQVAELNALHIYNVEGLADIADVHLNRSPTLRELRTKAKAWLAQASSGAEVTRLASDLDEANAKLSKQQTDMAELQAQVKELLEQNRKLATKR